MRRFEITRRFETARRLETARRFETARRLDCAQRGEHRTQRWARYLPALLLGFTLSSAPSWAEARVEEALRYTKLQSYRAALRYLRVDNGYNVLEKDQDSGYLLFEYPSDDEKTPGSIEIIERDGSVALVVQLPQMPSYHERHLIQGLLNKLRSDYGSPPEQPSRPNENPKKAPAKESAKDEPPPSGEPDTSSSPSKEKKER